MSKRKILCPGTKAATMIATSGWTTIVVGLMQPSPNMTGPHRQEAARWVGIVVAVRSNPVMEAEAERRSGDIDGRVARQQSRLDRHRKGPGRRGTSEFSRMHVA